MNSCSYRDTQKEAPMEVPFVLSQRILFQVKVLK